MFCLFCEEGPCLNRKQEDLIAVGRIFCAVSCSTMDCMIVSEALPVMEKKYSSNDFFASIEKRYSVILNAVGAVYCCGVRRPDGLEFSVLNLDDQGEKSVLIGKIFI